MSVEHNAELTRSTKRWREVRLWYKSGATLDGVFSFKRESLAPLLRKEGVSYAFILDEPEFVLARMELDSEGEARLTVELESVVRTEHAVLQSHVRGVVARSRRTHSNSRCIGAPSRSRRCLQRPRRARSASIGS